MKNVDILVLCRTSDEERAMLEDWVATDEQLCNIIYVDGFSTSSFRKGIQKLKTTYVLVLDVTLAFHPAYQMVARMQALEEANAAIVYADYYEEKLGKVTLNRLIPYQEGCIRDDFNFGPVKLMSLAVLREWAVWESCNYSFAAAYSLRLFASRKGKIIHLPEPLSTKKELDTRKSGEKQFDYVRRDAALIQKEMEQICTIHLKEIGAFLAPPRKDVAFEGDFPVEASVVIPVKNRINTIADAIQSVLQQSTSFSFNLIVVDNHSDDGTTALVKELAEDKRLIHCIPERTDLGIGGCWSKALHHPACGKFLVQLDSDDLYKDNNTLQQIVEKFYEEKCAMVIGSYEMVDFKLNPLPPGIIDHREWTDDNGPNNALRINGLGAPRAFYVPVLKQIGIPNVSYGEDYAIGIAISREYRIGRIYEPIYLCRRWEGNSDAALNNETVNAHNYYKDFLRSIEIFKRQNSCKSD